MASRKYCQRALFDSGCCIDDNPWQCVATAMTRMSRYVIYHTACAFYELTCQSSPTFPPSDDVQRGVEAHLL